MRTRSPTGQCGPYRIIRRSATLRRRARSGALLTRARCAFRVHATARPAPLHRRRLYDSRDQGQGLATEGKNTPAVLLTQISIDMFIILRYILLRFRKLLQRPSRQQINEKHKKKNTIKYCCRQLERGRSIAKVSN